MTLLPIYEWGLGLPKGRTLIAGPCSAESQKQVRESCTGAVRAGAHMVRAGVWKPRTRPGHFEGHGSKALKWLKKTGRQLNVPVCTEVATPDHVEQALEHNIDVLWVGARSTANPFTVQEIASALKGTDIPILIKNPVNPDLALWVGAIERFYETGIRRIAAIHRGFSLSHSSPYRNMPLWEIPVELKRRYPQLPILCDPSHIAGATKYIRDIAQRAYDLNMDGLMIETHKQPASALSDPDQQITPKQLSILIQSLVNRKKAITDPDFLANLEALRYDLDCLDHEIIEFLSKRMEVAREIGRYKKRNGVTILQQERWEKTFQNRVEKACSLGLSKGFAERLIALIHQESIRQQDHIMNQQNGINSNKTPAPGVFTTKKD